MGIPFIPFVAKETCWGRESRFIIGTCIKTVNLNNKVEEGFFLQMIDFS